MILPSSGLISLDDIITEFGGGNNLADYYRGGSYVTSTHLAGTGLYINSFYTVSIPSSGLIKLSDFYSKSSYFGVGESDLASLGSYGTGDGMSPITAGFSFDGNEFTTFGSPDHGWSFTGISPPYPTSGPYTMDWCGNPSTVMDYEVKFVYSSGPTPSGDSVDTWLDLSTIRQWYITDETTETLGEIHIRDVASSVVLTEVEVGMRTAVV